MIGTNGTPKTSRESVEFKTNARGTHGQKVSYQKHDRAGARTHTRQLHTPIMCQKTRRRKIGTQAVTTKAYRGVLGRVDAEVGSQESDGRRQAEQEPAQHDHQQGQRENDAPDQHGTAGESAHGTQTGRGVCVSRHSQDGTKRHHMLTLRPAVETISLENDVDSTRQDSSSSSERHRIAGRKSPHTLSVSTTHQLLHPFRCVQVGSYQQGGGGERWMERRRHQTHQQTNLSGWLRKKTQPREHALRSVGAGPHLCKTVFFF